MSQTTPGTGEVHLAAFLQDLDTQWSAVLDAARILVVTWLPITLALLLIARLLALLVRPEHQWNPDRFRGLLLASLGLIAVAAAVWTGAVAATTSNVRIPLIVLAAPLSVAGVALLASALGHRLRVLLEVVGSDGKPTALAVDYVSARLATMGGNKPRGITSPQGSDVVSLPNDALAELPNGKLAAAVMQLGRALCAVSPWRASIAVLDDDTVTVSLSRNGWVADSTVVERAALGLPPAGTGAEERTGVSPAQRDLLTGAAAFLLIELSKAYPPLCQGLCGATHWRSFACQVLAGTPPWQDSDAVTELLARAVEKDPGNHAAWLAYLYHRSGDMVGDKDSERRYAMRLQKLRQWMSEPIARQDVGYVPLHLRLLLNLSSAWVNCGLRLSECLKDTAYPLADERHRHEAQCTEAFILSLEAATALIREIEAIRDNPHYPDGVRTFAKEMAPVAGTGFRYVAAVASRRSIHGDTIETPELAREWTEGKQDEYSLTAHYWQACVASERGELEEGLDELDLAAGLSRLRTFAPSDPSLAALRQSPRFSLLTNGHRTLGSIEVLSQHAANLAANGILRPQDLLGRDSGDADLAKALNVTPAALPWIRGICQLAIACPRTDQAIAWTDLLTREGITDTESLHEAVDDAAAATTLLSRLQSAAAAACVLPPDRHELADWARRTSPAPAFPARSPIPERTG